MSMVGQWSFNEGEGDTAYDSSGFGNTGTLEGDPEWTDGVHGKALEFDGDDEQSVETSSDVSNMLPGETTINMWVEFDSDYTSRNCILYSRGDSETPRTGGGSDSSSSADNVNIQHRETDTLRVYLPEGGDGTGRYASTTIPFDEPVMVTITWDEDSQENRIYLDGELEAEDTSGGFDFSEFKESNNAPLIIGNNGGDQPHKGIIDEVQIWNKELSEDEIQSRAGYLPHRADSEDGEYETLEDSYTHKSGLQGMWHFDETSGSTVEDSSGNNNDGTLVNDPEWVDGRFGNALEFDGENDYVDIGDNNIDLGNSGTVSLWAHPRMEEGDTRGNLFEGGYSGDDRLYTFMYPDSEFEVGLGASNNIGIGWYPEMDKLYYFALVWDGGEFEVYANNEKVGDGTYSGEVSTDQGNWYIGNSYFGDYYFEGLIDDVRVYDRALSESEISDLYNNRYKELGDEVAHWKMNEGFNGLVPRNGTNYDIEDTSNNSNHGTEYGNVSWTGSYIPRYSKLDFNGTDDHVEVESFDIGNEGSLGGWILSRGIGDEHQAIIGHHTGADDRLYLLIHTGNDEFQLGISDSYSRAGNVEYDKWHHLFMTWEDNKAYMFVNGEQIDSLEFEGNVSSDNENWEFGQVFGQYLDGKLEDIRIYDRALSENEIQELYQNKYKELGDEVGWWTMQEGSGDTLIDRSSNTNNGTIYGANWTDTKGWDFTHTWKQANWNTDYYGGVGYPSLQWQDYEGVKVPTGASPSDGEKTSSLKPILSVTVDHTKGKKMDVTFYNKTNNSEHVEIATVENVSAGDSASTQWPNRLEEGEQRTWYAVAEDTDGQKRSSNTQTFEVKTLQEPTTTAAPGMNSKVVILVFFIVILTMIYKTMEKKEQVNK